MSPKCLPLLLPVKNQRKVALISKTAVCKSQVVAVHKQIISFDPKLVCHLSIRKALIINNITPYNSQML